LHGALNHGTFDVELVERSPVWAAVGGGLAVQPNVVRALHRIGMGAEVERAATNVGRWVYRTQRGDVLCTVDLADVWSAVGLFVASSGGPFIACWRMTRPMPPRYDDRRPD
jgi:2-polyprenyl-6-methoxyphenol hydroxylase-like FAD-dependent oxidoreductase